MTSSTADSDDAQHRLKEIEDEIARLRGDYDSLGEGLGDDAGPHDAEDTAAADTNREETEALLEMLEDRRAALLDQLSGER